MDRPQLSINQELFLRRLEIGATKVPREVLEKKVVELTRNVIEINTILLELRDCLAAKQNELHQIRNN